MVQGRENAVPEICGDVIPDHTDDRQWYVISFERLPDGVFNFQLFEESLIDDYTIGIGGKFRREGAALNYFDTHGLEKIIVHAVLIDVDFTAVFFYRVSGHITDSSRGS